MLYRLDKFRWLICVFVLSALSNAVDYALYIHYHLISFIEGDITMSKITKKEAVKKATKFAKKAVKKAGIKTSKGKVVKLAAKKALKLVKSGENKKARLVVKKVAKKAV
ncbi:MAG: hypothetical protein ACI9U5_000153 [Colwellia sp.]